MTADRYVPRREDRFSFGIWTVGWQGVDVFGGAVRPPMAADRAVRKRAALGGHGRPDGAPEYVDTLPADRPDSEREAVLPRGNVIRAHQPPFPVIPFRGNSSP